MKGPRHGQPRRPDGQEGAASWSRMWWAEAGKYQVLPLDDRFYTRALDREALYAEPDDDDLLRRLRAHPTLRAPQTLNRSWTMTRRRSRSPTAAPTGPIAAMGGDSSGWTLYLNDGVPTFCYNFPGPEYTYIRGTDAAARRAATRSATSSRRPAPSRWAPAAPARLFVDDAQVADGADPAHLHRRLLDGRNLRHRLGQGLTVYRGLRAEPSSPARSSASTSTSIPTSTPTITSTTTNGTWPTHYSGRSGGSRQRPAQADRWHAYSRVDSFDRGDRCGSGRVVE